MKHVEQKRSSQEALAHSLEQNSEQLQQQHQQQPEPAESVDTDITAGIGDAHVSESHANPPVAQTISTLTGSTNHGNSVFGRYTGALLMLLLLSYSTVLK